MSTIEKPTIHEVAAKSRDITKFSLIGFHPCGEHMTELLRRVSDDTVWLVRTERGQVTEIAHFKMESGAFHPVHNVTLNNDEVTP